MNINKVERGFLWVLLVIGLSFFGTAFFMKSGIDIVMRIVFGGLVVLCALSEIYPGIVSKASKVIVTTIILVCAGLFRKVKRLRRREAINETDIIETKRL